MRRRDIDKPILYEILDNRLNVNCSMLFCFKLVEESINQYLVDKCWPWEKRHRDIKLFKRYSLTYRRETFKELGVEFGISKEQARNINNKVRSYIISYVTNKI